jgi:ribonuclease HI
MVWQPDNPITLPNGRLVCNQHRRGYCGICCVDYTFTPESDEDEDHPRSDDDEYVCDGPLFKLSEGGGLTLNRELFRRRVNNNLDANDMAVRDPPGNTRASKFIAPSARDTVESLFTSRERFVRQTDPTEIVIYTDGSCLNNGQINPTAGWAFVFRPTVTKYDGSILINGVVSGRLEINGPSGIPYPQTSNRAELRAVIGALQFKRWDMESTRRLVIATDSIYVATGSTEWLPGWVRNGWQTKTRSFVKNQDLWQLLLQELQLSQSRGVHVLFWHIPRNCNVVADQAAKEAAGEDAIQDFTTRRDETNQELKTCGGCGIHSAAPGTPLLRCGGCQKLYYCSKKCQRADWKQHKSTCQSRPKAPPADPHSYYNTIAHTIPGAGDLATVLNLTPPIPNRSRPHNTSHVVGLKYAHLPSWEASY